MVGTERTVPGGDSKARFFQDMLQTSVMPGFLMAMRVFYDGDIYVALPGGFKTLDWLVRYSLEVEVEVSRVD